MNIKRPTFRRDSERSLVLQKTPYKVLKTGYIRVAVNGVEILRYHYPFPNERDDIKTRIIAGPIGFLRHWLGNSFYKDIYVEENPKEDKLITLFK